MGICDSTTSDKIIKPIPSKNSSDLKVQNYINDPEDKTKINNLNKTNSKNKPLRYSRIHHNDASEIHINNDKLIVLNTGLPVDNYIIQKKLGEGSY